MSDSLGPHGLQNDRPPCPSPTLIVYSNSCPLSRWCHPTISSSVVSFSSCLQSFPESGSFYQVVKALEFLLQHQLFERLLLNHTKTPGFLAPGGEEFNPGPETRLDRSELLCNTVLLKYKEDRESFWHRHQKGGQKEYPLASVSNEVIYSPMNPKNVWSL